MRQDKDALFTLVQVMREIYIRYIATWALLLSSSRFAAIRASTLLTRLFIRFWTAAVKNSLFRHKRLDIDIQQDVLVQSPCLMINGLEGQVSVQATCFFSTPTMYHFVHRGIFLLEQVCVPMKEKS